MPKKPFVYFRDIRSRTTMEKVSEHYGVLDPNHPYLAERGITPEAVAEFGLGYCAKGSMAGRIIIPIHNAGGELVACAGRWPGEPPNLGTAKYKLPKGFKKSAELFNLNRAIHEPADRPLVIVEGFFDAIKLWQHGCRKVVALIGNTMSVAQEGLIRKHTNTQSQVIVALDKYDAGSPEREKLANRLAKFCFVRIQQLNKPNTKPEHLSCDEVERMLQGFL